jgi:hypothetical protein
VAAIYLAPARLNAWMGLAVIKSCFDTLRGGLEHSIAAAQAALKSAA